MRKISLTIRDCKECPYSKQGRMVSTDGFDVGHEWWCTKANPNMMIDGFHEWHDKKIEIPANCPIILSSKYPDVRIPKD